MSSPFFIQPISKLGLVHPQSHDQQFEEAIGAQAHGLESAEFIGAGISATRWRWLCIALLVVMVFFGMRSAYMQLMVGEAFLRTAEGNRIVDERILPMRGSMVDRAGRPLVTNRPAFSLWVRRELLDDAERYPTVLNDLASLLDRDPASLHDTLLQVSQRDGQEILITQDLNSVAALNVLASPERYEALRIEDTTRREYHLGGAQSLSHLLGYMAIITPEQYAVRRSMGYQPVDLTGKEGLERTYEDLLRGVLGNRRVETDAYGDALTILSSSDPVQGADIQLHVDAPLQAFIEQRLNALRIERASVIVLDPRDGAVRALVSYPGFDANIFGGYVDAAAYRALVEHPDQPLFPRATSGQFPSGSTIKPIVATAALEERLIDEHTSFVSTGGLRIGSFFFPDWKAGGHGTTSVRKAIAESVNTFFYIVGGGYLDVPGLGIERMTLWARTFGLGTALGIDLPSEASGFLPSAAWKRETKGEPWYIGDTYHVAIGQGDVLVTPLQIAAMTAIFANGGTLMAPTLVDRYRIEGREHDVDPVIIRASVASPATIDIVRQGLRQAVTGGSARRLASLPIAVAGKTGTAQWHSVRKPHAWFTGFAPYQQAEIVVTILIEEGGEGSAVAVPLAHDIFAWWFANTYN